jgi:hypothetical protein
MSQVRSSSGRAILTAHRHSRVVCRRVAPRLRLGASFHWTMTDISRSHDGQAWVPESWQERARRLVADWPPLTDEQIVALRDLLAGATKPSTGDLRLD